jgi:cleavage stimulation factor subunit 3
MHSTSSAPNPDVVDETDQQQINLPKPDLNQMIPYKPKAKPYVGEHPIPGKKQRKIF